jgi:DNA-binding PadR family transcriptional regulator
MFFTKWLARRVDQRVRRVLEYLVKAGPSYGLDISEDCKIWRASVYIYLSEMVDWELISMEWLPAKHGLRRARYAITEKGRAYLGSLDTLPPTRASDAPSGTFG